jgi:hypothetical protein
MFKKFLFLVILLPAFAFSQESGSANFQGLGFSINTFNVKEMPNNQAILSFFLPASENFAPNVNVLSQDFNGSPVQYKELTESQLKSPDYKTITSKVENDSYILEYTGVYNNQKLHFYSIAKFRNGKAVLATATATFKQWDKYKTELISVINSLNLNK